MFGLHKPRYMTRVLSKELSREHLHLVLKYLQEQQPQLTEYLQVFEFYIENNKQWLLQRQEEPNRETTIFVNLEESEPIERKVWAMDKGNEGVMIIFPEDY